MLGALPSKAAPPSTGVLSHFLGTQMCCLRSTSALPLLPSTLCGHTAMPPAVRTRALSLASPVFTPSDARPSQSSTAQYKKLIPPQSITHWSWHLITSLRKSVPSASGLQLPTQPNKSHQGEKKNIFSTSSDKEEKKICLKGPEHRGNIIPLYWVSGESFRVISTQTASLGAILSTTEGFNNPF